MYSAKDQCWAWKSVVGGFISFGMCVSIDLSYSVVFKDIKEFYQVNSTVASSLFGLILGCRFLLSPIAVLAIRYFGCDKVTIFGGLTISLGLFFTSCSPNIVMFMLSYGILVGTGVSLIYTASLIVISENFEKRKALAFGVATSGASISYIIFPHIFAFIMTEFEFRSALMLFSAFSLNIIISGLLSGRSQSGDVIDSSIKSHLLVAENQSFKTSHKSNRVYKPFQKTIFYVKPITNQRFLFFVGGVTLLFVGTVPWTIFIVDFIHSIKEVNLNIAVLTFTAEGLSQIIARTFVGVIFDLRVVRKYRGVICSSCCFLSALSCLLLVTMNPTIFSYLFVSVLRGLSLGIFFSQNVVILGDLCDRNYISMSIGFLTFMKGIGSIVGSVLSGVIRDTFQSYFETFIFLSATQFVAGLLILYANVINVCRDKSTIV